MNPERSSRLLFSFYAVSDLHITQKARGKAAGKRYKAWKYLENTECSFLLIAGDITNGCGREEFDNARAELDPLISRFPVLAAYGNHDYIPNSPNAAASPESRRQFSHWMQEKNLKHGCGMEFFNGIQCFEARYRGVQILSMDCAATYPAAAAGDEQLAWLDEKLRHSDHERFRIVVSHFPLTNYVPGRTGRKQMSYVRDSLRQQRLLEKHKNILFFSGHTHFSLASDSPSMLYDESSRVAYFNTASVGNTLPNPGGGKEKGAENTSGSMGLLAEVFESGIQISGIDFLNGSELEACKFKLAL